MGHSTLCHNLFRSIFGGVIFVVWDGLSPTQLIKKYCLHFFKIFVKNKKMFQRTGRLLQKLRRNEPPAGYRRPVAFVLNFKPTGFRDLHPASRASAT
jgi:hypothetical protein